ncbi:Ig-like domain-containing protein [Frigoriflavimonas asaccharolytica]|uniref:Uncharacterized protein n=1 Tax=Frigoriflavimonas asaccharolytica TaxID=2735899 RepID=A0A8J8G9I2_9FLAO|nr:Ig-like domain-containing protein [Frigoriflavimonas asaccharolytica]NRS93958.1 hypothetical protein [Frigoriflavimonas asaccharolytica]
MIKNLLSSKSYFVLLWLLLLGGVMQANTIKEKIVGTQVSQYSLPSFGNENSSNTTSDGCTTVSGDVNCVISDFNCGSSYNYANNLVGGWDGYYAKFYDIGDYVTLKLEHTLSPGQILKIKWKQRDYNSSYYQSDSKMSISLSETGSSYNFLSNYTTSNTNAVFTTVTVDQPTRYIKIQNFNSISNPHLDFLVDGITYSNTTCPTTPIATCAGNLLSNPSFEDGFTGYTPWSSTTANIQSDWVNSGNKAVVLSSGGGFARYITDNLTIGSTYTFKAYAKIHGTIDAKYILKAKDSAGNVIGNESISIAKNSGYNLYTLSIVIPAGTTTLALVAQRDNDHGNVFLDDWCLTYQPPSSNPVVSCPGNLMANSSFENDFTGWAQWTPGSSAIQSTWVNSGAKAAKLTGTGGVAQSFHNLTPGQVYTLKAYGKIHGNVSSSIGLKVWNSDYTSVLDQQYSVIANNSGYNLYTVTLTIPAGGAHLEAFAWRNDSSSNTGTVFVDDFCLTKVNATITIVANNDTFSIPMGTTNTTSVLTNDTLNGNVATLTNVNITQVSTTNLGVTLDPATGLTSVAAGTPAGTYTINYKICDKTSTATCNNATVTVTVPSLSIDAVTETFPAINGTSGGTTATSVLLNDTLGTQAATLTNVNLTAITVPTGLTLNASGTITVAPNTPAGNYNVTYKICDKVNPANCDTVTSTVPVTAPAIVAVDDVYTILPGDTGIPNVLANDKLNGSSATLGNVNITQLSTTNSGVTLNPATGLISVATGTPAGIYTVNYRICDKVNPANCTTANAVVTVENSTEPDMTVKVSASAATYSAFNDIDTFYKVSNIGNGRATGRVTLTVMITAEAGDISFTLPQGWRLETQVGMVLTFVTNKSFAPSANDTIVVNYTSYGGFNANNAAVFNAIVSPGSGGETNTTNNAANEVIQRINN